MKINRLINFLVLVGFTIASAFVTSCEGPVGPAGQDGSDGVPGVPGVACTVSDNGDGTFTMTCDQGSVIFGEAEEPAAYVNADIARGGQLYDKFWNVTGNAAPTGDHALYPTFGEKAGADTWRCKECHGWDYLGKDGRYSGGSHYTGIKGLYPTNESLWRAYITINDDHGYGTAGLTDTDIWDLVKFYREGLIDMSTILADDGTFIGQSGTGKNLYENGIPGSTNSGTTTNSSCSSCHGLDGTNQVVGGFTAFVGLLSNDNPQEFLHKVRFGHPGSTMPASEDIKGSLNDVVNLSAYSQTLSPTLWDNTDVARGGQLYDKYWIVTSGTAPTTDHILYPAAGSKSAGDTWRCKECHGWDYIGKDGRYKSGSHYTGIKGLYPVSKTKWQAFIEIKNGHGYGDGQLTDTDIWDLVAFYDAGMYDVNFILNPDGTFRGSTVAGQALFEGGIGGGASCSSCHGLDGTNPVVAGFTDFPGFLSNDNPQEFAHKVLYGQPGTTMVKTYDFGATLENVADLSTYSQTLPQN